jgi:hypothetical protein
MAEQGWSFAAGDDVVPDPIGGAHYLHEVYTRSDPTYSGRATVPVLWDKQTGTSGSRASQRLSILGTSSATTISAVYIKAQLNSRPFLPGLAGTTSASKCAMLPAK